jgi:hypothetical protein
MLVLRLPITLKNAGGQLVSTLCLWLCAPLATEWPTNMLLQAGGAISNYGTLNIEGAATFESNHAKYAVREHHIFPMTQH